MSLLIYMQKSRVPLSKSLRKKESKKKRKKQLPLLASLLLSDTNLYNLSNFYSPCLSGTLCWKSSGRRSHKGANEV